MTGSQQLSINFAPGLLEQFPDFMDCVRASVYGCGKPLKIVAADCDMSESTLSRRLAKNPNDSAHFPLEALPALMRSTGDKRPALWIALSFLQDEEQVKQQAMSQIIALAPVFAMLASQAGIVAQPTTKAKR